MQNLDQYLYFKKLPLDQFPKLMSLEKVLELKENLDINLQILLRYRLVTEMLVGTLYKDIVFSEIAEIRRYYANSFKESSW